MKQNSWGLPDSLMPGQMPEHAPRPGGSWRLWWYQYRYWLGVVVIIVIAAVLLARTSWLKKTNQLPQAPTRSEVKVGDLPANFPSDLPYISSDQAVVSNFQVDSAAGTQGVRAWVVQAKPFDAYTVFKDYLKTRGWTLVLDVPQGPPYVLAAHKNDRSLNISVRTESDRTIVEIGAR